MLVSEARKFIGFEVDFTYQDRQGQSHTQRAEIFDISFVPLYGPCLITDSGDFRLDRITGIVPLQTKAA